MRVLGIDVGAKRFGVALSDELGLTAQPLETIAAREVDPLERVAELVALHGVEVVVVGLPLSLGGGDRGASSRRARAFGERIAARCRVDVIYRDERFTTAEAERVLVGGGVRRRARRGVVDKLAAALILQGYLDGRAR